MVHSSNSASVSDVQKNLDLLVASIARYATFWISTDGVIGNCNVAEVVHGYPCEELIGNRISKLLTSEDACGNNASLMLGTALRDGSYENEIWMLRKDGSRFLASLIISPIRDLAKKWTGFAAITRDLTERDEAQEVQRRSEERVVEYSICMLSPTGDIANWNAGAERMSGYSEIEVVGTNFARFFTEEDLGLGRPSEILELAANEGRYIDEGEWVRKDGSIFWNYVLVEAIRDERGKLVGFARIAGDLTERRGH